CGRRAQRGSVRPDPARRTWARRRQRSRPFYRRFEGKEQGAVASASSPAGQNPRNDIGLPCARPPRDELPAPSLLRSPSIRVLGNTQSQKASQVRALERLYRRHLPSDRLLTHEFARELATLSADVRRPVALLVDRCGAVTHAMVGDARGRLEMPEWGCLRAGAGRLRGFRCMLSLLAGLRVENRPAGDALTRAYLTELAKLRLDAM